MGNLCSGYKIKDPLPSFLDLLTTSTEEVGSPARLGASSFATVYIISGGLIAFKEVALVDSTGKLRQEYDTLDNICLQCNTDFLSTIPRALAYFNPVTEEFSTTASSLTSANRLCTVRSFVTPGVMSYFQRPTYAMDWVHPSPINTRRYLAERYFPSQLFDGPALCHLYFGKDCTGAPPSRFVNTLDFSLDRARYAQLTTLFQILRSATDFARAMSGTLFRFHHGAAVDARDIEFTLRGDGGAGFASPPSTSIRRV